MKRHRLGPCPGSDAESCKHNSLGPYTGLSVEFIHRGQSWLTSLKDSVAFPSDCRRKHDTQRKPDRLHRAFLEDRDERP